MSTKVEVPTSSRNDGNTFVGCSPTYENIVNELVCVSQVVSSGRFGHSFVVENDFDKYNVNLFNQPKPFISVTECLGDEEVVIVRKFFVNDAQDIWFLFDRMGGGISRLEKIRNGSKVNA